MDDPQWLERELQRGAIERWCMIRGCTTCGSFQMLELLTGKPWPKRGSSISVVIPTLNWERAELIVEGLKHCSSGTNRTAIMWMLFMIWERFGDAAHDELFTSIDSTFSGYVLAEMREHYAKKLEKQRLHGLRQGLKKKDWPE